MRIYDGKVFFRIERGPWYTSGVNEKESAKGYKKNVCLKSWKLPFGYYLSKRQLVICQSNELHDAIFEAARRYWKTDNIKVTFDSLIRYTITNIVTGADMAYYDETYKFFKMGKMRFTDNPQVLFCEDNQKYYGYSHRGSCGFGIGDMLFSEMVSDKSVRDIYCKEPKYRREFIKVLKHYHRNNDSFGFYDLIKSGIMDVVPFKKRGVKRIENQCEAFEAARNFARYIS